jgi:hypothetical protein
MAQPKFEDDYTFPDEVKVSAKDDEKFEIEVEDDTPEQDRGRKKAPPPEDPTDEELASYDEKVQQRIKKFTRGYHDERRAKEEALREREAAEQFAREVYQENKRLKGQLKNGSEILIEQNKSTAQMQLEAAQKKFKEAYESGDADGVASAQMEITKATLWIDRAEQMRPIEEPDIPLPQQAPKQPQVSPRTQKWLHENSDWFGSDDEMTMMAMGLDKKLQREYGANYIGTEEYFRTIDKTMRKRFPERFGDAQSHEDEDTSYRTSEPDEDDRPPRRATKPTSPVAPASRSTPPNRIRLKASEAAIARRLGVPIEEYAKQVAQLKRNN